MSETSPRANSADEMTRLISSLPDQLRDAANCVPALTRLPTRPARIWLCGMGGSAIAGELLAACDDLALPEIRVHRSYSLPQADVADSFFVFSSYSGETEELLSAYDCLRDAGAETQRIVMSSGGSLVARAERDGVPVLRLSGGLPPRATLGWGVAALLHAFQRLGVAEGIDEALSEAESVLRSGEAEYRPTVETASNPARRLALRLYGKLPLLYAGCPIATAAAWRWKAQINENANALAYVSNLPELDHNEIAGFGAASGLPEHCFVLALRDAQEHPRVQRRFSVTQEILASGIHAFESVESRGRGQLARILSLAQFGDYISLYLAEAYGVDPMAIEAIDRLKARLSDQG